LALPDSVFPCEICGRIYNHAVLKNCPGCAAALAVDTGGGKRSARATATSSSPDSALHQGASNDRIASLLETLIDETRQNRVATNRTTYVIRAVVSYIAIMVITGSIAGFVYGFGTGAVAASGNSDGLIWTWIFTALIVLVGEITALTQFFKQWRLSRVTN
jgi:hypothetical protein